MEYSKPSVRGSLNSVEALPVTPEEITATWCSKILGRQIQNVTIAHIIHGTATKLLLDITDTSPPGDPSSKTQRRRICLKGGFDPQLRAQYPGLNATYRREAEFYYHIAPAASPSLRLPRVWYCGSDTVTGQGVVALADLAADGCAFGNPVTPWPVDRARAGVAQLAALHARTWDATVERFPWLAGGIEANPCRAIVRELLGPAAWARRFAEGERPPVPPHLADRTRMVAAFEALWRSADAGSGSGVRLRCVVHGDAHLGNTFVTAAGEPGFLDWQGVHLGSPFHDVAYFVTGALGTADRRRHEGELVERYLDELARLGGPRLAREEVWDEYRKHVLHGFVWALPTPQMQARENVFAMAERHAAAIVDHGSLELLEGLPEYEAPGRDC
ncbi:kinase-like domain-containing protein [Whalleya microplaca]|nr:kinase-like domain-containing protein [Whalleya microplaca]